MESTRKERDHVEGGRGEEREKERERVIGEVNCGDVGATSERSSLCQKLVTKSTPTLRMSLRLPLHNERT